MPRNNCRATAGGLGANVHSQTLQKDGRGVWGQQEGPREEDTALLTWGNGSRRAVG